MEDTVGVATDKRQDKQQYERGDTYISPPPPKQSVRIMPYPTPFQPRFYRELFTGMKNVVRGKVLEEPLLA